LSEKLYRAKNRSLLLKLWSTRTSNECVSSVLFRLTV